MEKIIKNIMILITILIIMIIGILIYLLKINEEVASQEEIYFSDQDIHFRNDIEKVTSKYEFFDTETCIKKYIKLLQKLNKNSYQNNEVGIEETINIYQNELYNLLDQDYIKENKLTIENIDTNLSNYYYNMDFQIKTMYVIDAEEELPIYFVYGNLINTDKNTIERYGFIVKRNTQNLTFSILPYEFMIDNGYEEEKLLNCNFEKIKNKSVLENGDNYYTSNAYDSEYISKYYFNIYKNNLQFNTEDIYNDMNKDYREKRFGTLEDYNKYIEKNYDELLKCNINQYTTRIESNITSYICKDQFGNYYIFNETSIGEYNILLDTYTTEQKEFNEKYEKATNNEKVGMNISKFFQMINAKDYKSVYGVLSNNFKNNNFNTEESLEQYLENKLYSYNEVDLINFSDEISGVYTYYIEITNKENEEDNKIKMNIVMQLLEGTQFRLSFQIID